MLNRCHDGLFKKINKFIVFCRNIKTAALKQI